MGISLKQLTDTISLVKEYCVSKFTHDNIKVLNKLSESDNGKMLYDNISVTKDLEQKYEEQIVLLQEQNSLLKEQLAKAIIIIDSINKESV